MRNNLIITAILLLLSTTIFSQNNRDKEWKEDIDYIITRIEIMHPNLYGTISEEVFKANTEKLKKRVPSISDSDVAIGILELLASIRDGHTFLSYFRSNPKLMNEYFHIVPLNIHHFSDGLFIMSAAKKHEKYVGYKIIKINDVSVDKVVSKVSNLICADNKYGEMSGITSVIIFAEILKYYGIGNSTTEITFDLENNYGEIETVIFNTEPLMESVTTWFRGLMHGKSDSQQTAMNVACSEPLPFWLTNTEENYWYEYLEDKKAYYVQINALEHNKEENFTDFTNRMFKEFDKNKAQKLIIDLRLNDGGQHIEMPLFKGIVSRPELDKPENLFLLTSRIVFSASQHFTSIITNYTNATLIGEPTGSRPNFYGSPLTFSPPNNDGLVIMISTKYFQEVDFGDYSLATKPDFFVPFTSENYKNNLDPVLEKVFDYKNYSKLSLDYQEKLQRAFTKKGLKGLKSEYQNLKNDIIENGIDMEEIFLSSFDLWMMRNRKNDDEYIEYLEFIVKEFPDCSTAWYWLADWVKEKRGTPEKAKEYYLKCLKINPENHFAKMDYELMLLK